MHSRLFVTVLMMLGVVGGGGVVGCAEPDDVEAPEELGETQSAIRRASPANAFKEAVLVGDFCSGALIAPRVVLTAAHCVAQNPNNFGYEVKAPFADGAPIAIATGGARWDGNSRDVGLVYLDRPINLPVFPTMARHRVSKGTRAILVGRNNDSNYSYSALFRATYKIASSDNLYYRIDESVIRGGDSGGPDFLADASTHVIIGVNAYETRGDAYLARVDVLTDWIRTRVEENGGFANGGGFSH